ncbi:L-lysine exporter family protein LysE/ArgO [Pseudomonas duriflava]|uniref:L-lysine exporter family protein LysE/ArgO n=1 Tax=Pseudomonas duriflava TaxID=459528 RepID=A0A562QP20_9PSED|nr:LysE family transporter [Pseudomonas duriflava]TWI58508.1 L-lysine exporter family protein LysE/ArgO [Pseudomonas duriflava]
MWQSYLTGLFTMAGLIVAVGAQNTFVLAQGLRREHHLAVALLCLLCDSLLITAGVFGLATLLAKSALLTTLLLWAGIIFLLGYSGLALHRALRPQALHSEAAAPRRLGKTLLLTLAVTLLNPHVYVDTILLIGSLGIRQPVPTAFVLGAACASALWFLGLALGSARLAPYLAKPQVWRLIDLGVALAMLLAALPLIRQVIS